MEQNCLLFKEDLIKNRFHPKNISKFRDWKIDGFEDNLSQSILSFATPVPTSIFKTPAPVALVLIDVTPLTSRVVAGAVVPIPTPPISVIIILSVIALPQEPFVEKTIDGQ